MHWMTTCHGCSASLRVHDDHQGLFLQCPRCATPVAVRSPKSVRAGTTRLLQYRWHAGLALIFVVTLLLGSRQSNRRPGSLERSERTTMSMMRAALANDPVPVARGGGPAPGGVGPVAPLAPDGPRMKFDTRLVDADRKDGPLFDPTRPDPPLTPTGKIAPFLCLTGDRETGTLITASQDQTLRVYSRDLELRTHTRLPQAAYAITLDAARGRLYAATAPPGNLSLSSMGDREYGVGHLYVFDIRDALRGKPLAEELRPVHTRIVDGHVIGMCLSGDGHWLAYLAESPRDIHMTRLDLDSLDATPEPTHPLRAGNTALLAQAPDGTVFVVSGGHLIRYETATGKLTPLIILPGNIHGLAALPDDRLVLMERAGATLSVLLIDHSAKIPRLLGRYTASLGGRVYLRSVGQQLYLGSSAVLDGQIRAFSLPPTPGRFRIQGKAVSGPRQLLRGGLHLTPDGRHVLSGNGHVFAAPAG